MPDDFCFNVPIMHASPSLGSLLAQGVAEVLPAAAGADESMPDGSAELYEVQVEAETAVQPDGAGGVADRLPDELVGRGRQPCLRRPHAEGIRYSVPFPSSRRHTSTSTCLVPGEEFNALFSFEEAVDKLHVADADAASPATSASAGLTSATARPPGRCFSLCWLSSRRPPYLPQVPALAARCRC